MRIYKDNREQFFSTCILKRFLVSLYTIIVIPLTTMAVINRYRTVWGIEAGENYENWLPWLPELKKQGYCEKTPRK